MPLDGTNMSTFDELILTIIFIAFSISILVALGEVVGRRILWCKKGYALWICVLGCVATGYAGYIVNGHFELVSYWNFIHEKTTLYEENYVDGRDVALTFPEEKRNLIYIFMESMETTYASQSAGGGMETGCIPMLEQLAMDNIDFSDAGWIPEDYYEWWGFEDEKLFAFARKELSELAGSGQPFNLTLLTADTHFTDGYLCRNCKDEYGDQYSNVIVCSDRMVTEFVKWIQQQEKMIETACGGRIRSRKKNGSYQRFRYSDAVQPSIFLNTLLK